MPSELSETLGHDETAAIITPSTVEAGTNCSRCGTSYAACTEDVLRDVHDPKANDGCCDDCRDSSGHETRYLPLVAALVHRAVAAERAKWGEEVAQAIETLRAENFAANPGHQGSRAFRDGLQRAAALARTGAGAGEADGPGLPCPACEPGVGGVHTSAGACRYAPSPRPSETGQEHRVICSCGDWNCASLDQREKGLRERVAAIAPTVIREVHESYCGKPLSCDGDKSCEGAMWKREKKILRRVVRAALDATEGADS